MITQLIWTTWTSMSAVPKRLSNLITHSIQTMHVDRLMQERRNSIANALELTSFLHKPINVSLTIHVMTGFWAFAVFIHVPCVLIHTVMQETSVLSQIEMGWNCEMKFIAEYMWSLMFMFYLYAWDNGYDGSNKVKGHMILWWMIMWLKKLVKFWWILQWIILIVCEILWTLVLVSCWSCLTIIVIIKTA